MSTLNPDPHVLVVDISPRWKPLAGDDTTLTIVPVRVVGDTPTVGTLFQLIIALNTDHGADLVRCFGDETDSDIGSARLNLGPHTIIAIAIDSLRDTRQTSIPDDLLAWLTYWHPDNLTTGEPR